MKITVKIESENLFTKPRNKDFNVSDEECRTMVKHDLEIRRASSDRPETVQPRTPQEIMDEFNRELENSHRRVVRHYGELKVPYHKDDEDEPNPWDNIPDNSDERNRQNREDNEELCQTLHKLLKSEYAEIIIAVVLNDIPLEEFAGMHGLTYDNAAKRLQRAKKKLFEKIS